MLRDSLNGSHKTLACVVDVLIVLLVVVVTPVCPTTNNTNTASDFVKQTRNNLKHLSGFWWAETTKALPCLRLGYEAFQTLWSDSTQFAVLSLYYFCGILHMHKLLHRKEPVCSLSSNFNFSLNPQWATICHTQPAQAHRAWKIRTPKVWIKDVVLWVEGLCCFRCSWGCRCGGCGGKVCGWRGIWYHHPRTTGRWGCAGSSRGSRSGCTGCSSCSGRNGIPCCACQRGLCFLCWNTSLFGGGTACRCECCSCAGAGKSVVQILRICIFFSILCQSSSHRRTWKYSLHIQLEKRWKKQLLSICIHKTLVSLSKPSTSLSVSR